MAINWPTIAQGSGTGTTYTAPAPNYNTWTWNGYAWTSKSTTPKGGFGGTWVIFDQYGKARSFPILQSAIDYASSGDTINLFQNTREIVTTNYHVRITKDININLNGFEYILDAQSDLTLTGYAISNINTFGVGGSPDSLYEIDVKIYNGKITLVNVLNDPDEGHDPPLILIGEPLNLAIYSNLNFGSNWNFNNVTFESSALEQYVAVFRSNVNGGTFYSNEYRRSGHGGVAVYLDGCAKLPNKKSTIFRNITGISEFGDGIRFGHFDASPTRSFLINCNGETRRNLNDWPTNGISALNSESFGGMMYNCTGISTRPTFLIEGGEYIAGMAVGRYIKAIKCTGSSMGKSQVGITTNSTTLVHCVGMSEYAGFKSYGGTQFKLCSNGYSPLMSYGLIVSNIFQNIPYLNGDSIENCSLEGNSSAIARDSTSSGAGHYVNVFNSVLKGGNSGIEMSYMGNTQLRAANNVISYNESSNSGQVISIVTGGTNGSVIANNVLKGKGGSLSNGSYAIKYEGVGTTATIYMSGNSCVNYDSMIRPNTPFLSYISQGMTASSDNYGTCFQRYYITQNK